MTAIMCSPVLYVCDAGKCKAYRELERKLGAALPNWEAA